MLKNDTCITVINKAVLEIFHFKAYIRKKSDNWIFSQCQHKKWRTIEFMTSRFGDLLMINLQEIHHISVI